MAGKIQLLLPGLFDIPPAECDARLLAEGLPHLNRLLRYARVLPNRAFSIDALLREALRLDADDGAASTLAMAQAAVDDETSPGGRLLLFKPVHLQTGLHNALIVPIEADAQNLEDITLLINDLKDLFKVDCDIKQLFDGLYLMRLHAVDAPLNCPHLLSVLGKPANPYIAQTRDHLDWYKLLNEMQMFMYQHEVNQQRERHNRLSINSLWCWGAGELPARPVLPGAWFCDDELIGRLAARLGLPPRRLAEIETAPAGGDLVAVDLRLIECLKSGGAASLEALLQEIDDGLLRPLLAQVAQNRSRLRLRAGHEHDYELGPASKLCFWRSRRDLASCLQAAEAA